MMGQAKLRSKYARPAVYHHTSALRTNLIWMSGVIEVEGKGQPAMHPILNTRITTDALARRELKDFPPVAWFTTRLDTPKCLIETTLFFVNPDTGESKAVELDEKTANAIALNRFALGFAIEDIGVTPWPEYYGYATPEGQKLNEDARAAGDNPDEWYISESPVDMLLVSEIYGSPSTLKPKLKPMPTYINDVKRMVTLCRENREQGKSAFIFPTWLPESQAVAFAKSVGLPVARP